MLCSKNRNSLCIIVCLCVMFSSCHKKEQNAESTVRTVRTVQVVFEKIDNDLNSFGTISYKTKNDIVAQVEGTIAQLKVKEGDYVMKGETLAVLRNIQLELQKEQYEGSVITAEASLNVTRTKLDEEILNIESRLLSLEKSAIEIEQQKLELDDAIDNLEKQKALYEIGGITDSAYKSVQLSVKATKAEFEMLKKDREVSLLGLRDEDLHNNGYVVSDNEYERKQQLIDLNTRSVKAEIEASEANLENAKNNLKAVDMLLDELTITAPASGIIGAKYYETGEFVPENEKIFTIMDTSSVLAVFSIQEQDIINFETGTSLLVEITSLHKDIDATITEISPIADPKTGNFTVKAELGNRKNDIKPGMFVKCSIIRRTEESYAVIPDTTLLQKSGNTVVVYAVHNGYAVKRTLDMVSQKDGNVWIRSGLDEGDSIVDKPSPFLKEGEYVNVK